ncbi:MAG TPA: hypothetical protein VN736_05755 [Candidatus Limnocylindrales bacterium]|nr:hypothetical protein [Candidatus Limnocylindrales bacterium]
MTTTGIVILICVVVAIAVVAMVFLRKRRTQALRSHFGPEYQHAVREYGGQSKAEEALLARQKRREKLHIHPLSDVEKEHFSAKWHEVQARFVDDPPASIREADTLVTEAMLARGYPMTEFDHRAEDLSVDHPQEVKNYRAAHEIAQRQNKGEANTEDLRRALVYYRELFDDLLDVHHPVGSQGGRR